MTCSHPNKTTNGRYFLISNNGIEKDMKPTSNKTFHLNTTLGFKCNDGYTLPDNFDSQRTCQQNATWSGLEPTCICKHLLLSLCNRNYVIQSRSYCLNFLTYMFTDQKHVMHSHPLKQITHSQEDTCIPYCFLAVVNSLLVDVVTLYTASVQ